MEWQVAGLVIAIVSLVIGILALPTILQMFFGRPSVALEFARHAMGEERALIIFLKNPPVRSKVLRKIGVRRDSVQSLTVSMRLMEGGSGAVLDPIRHMSIKVDSEDDSIGRQRVILPPTYSIGGNLCVAIWDKDSCFAVVPPDHLRDALALGPGYYRVMLSVVVDGEPQMVAKHFVVGKSADDLAWVGA